MIIPSGQRWDYRQNRFHAGVPACAQNLRLEGVDAKRYDATFDLHAVKIAMALNIRNRTTEELAATLADLTGETKTEAVTQALRDRLVKIRRQRTGRNLCAELDEIARHCASLPILDSREPDDILGYDEHGLPYN